MHWSMARSRPRREYIRSTDRQGDKFTSARRALSPLHRLPGRRLTPNDYYAHALRSEDLGQAKRTG